MLRRSQDGGNEAKLAQHVRELVLTPGKKNCEDVYEVSGEWELLPKKKCVILMVARDGFGQDYAALRTAIRLSLKK